MIYILLIIVAAGVFLSVQIYNILQLDLLLIKYLCPVNSNFSCLEVLNSPFSWLTKKIHFSDVAIIYFSWQALEICFSIIFNRTDYIYLILLIPSILAFLFSLITLGYQIIIIKKYCSICLLLTIIIWIEIFLIIYIFNYKNGIILFNSLETVFHLHKSNLFLSIILFLQATLWLRIKFYILKSKQVDKVVKELNKFKNNSILFVNVLLLQNRFHYEILDDDYILGNKNSVLQFIIVLNPYCNSCAHLYKSALELLQYNSDKLSIVIRFNINPNTKNNNLYAVCSILNNYRNTTEENKRHILSNWFENKLLEHSNGNINLNQLKTLNKNYNWIIENKIYHSPFIILNGFYFPNPYNLNDLRFLIPQILKNKNILELIKFKF